MNHELLTFVAGKNDFKTFLKLCFKEIYGNKAFLDNWHIDAIIYELDSMLRGENNRLIINQPPRSLKSFIVTTVFTAYLLGHNPAIKIICTSYSDELSKTLSRDARRIMESKWYKKMFPEVRLIKCTETEIVSSKGGSRSAISTGGSLTGRGADVIIIDDPIKPDDAYSERLRKSNNEWLRSTLLSRLDDKKNGLLIVIMQRLHINDLTGFIEAGGGCKKLSLSAIATQDEKIQIGDNEYHFRKQGDVLHPEREDRATLEQIKRDIGPYNYSAQYQQQPEMPDGALFKKEWFKMITTLPKVPLDEGLLTLSLDTAMSDSETADYTALTLLYSHRDFGHIILQAERGHWSYEETLKRLGAYYNKYDRKIVFIVEAAGIGISIYRKLISARLQVYNYKPIKYKVARAMDIVPILSAGELSVFKQNGQNEWVDPYLNEFLSFPFGRYDDYVDTLSQVLPFAEKRTNPGKFTAFGT